MIRFIGGMRDGIMITSHDVRVRITHDIKEGYLPSADGGEIREELSLREFLERIFKEGHEVESELYRLSKCLSGGYQYNNNEIERVTHKYNVMYAELFRRGKMVLAQHKMSHNMIGGIDPYQQQQQRQQMSNMAQRSALDYHQQHMLREAACFVPPSRGILDVSLTQTEMLRKKEAEIEKKRTDDLFFLTT